MKLTLLGTGAAAGVPVWGCECKACAAARAEPARRRKPSCAALSCAAGTLLIDAGLTDLAARFTPRDLAGVLLTHFHVDHVAGLFAMRWGEVASIPTYAPADEIGCADLYQHPGPFAFQRPAAYEAFSISELRITPVPLAHSKPTYGYLIEDGTSRLVYLTDTKGLPPRTAAITRDFKPDLLVLDCTYPPQDPPPRNHNDVTLALACIRQVNPGDTLLIHISHSFDCWLQEHAASLPPGVTTGVDGMQIDLKTAAA